MAFTTAQKVKIRKYLGWPAYAFYDTSLESTIEAVGAIPEGQAEVEVVLANLATIETEITNLHGIALAQKVEESALNPKRYEDLRAAGRREVIQLATLLNALGSIRSDVFATASAGMTSFPLRMG